jgi:hypothetical protein
MPDEKQLRKDIDTLITEITKAIETRGLQEDAYWGAKATVLSAKISLLGDIISTRVLRATSRLFWLTVVLAILTFGLLVIAAIQVIMLK